MKRNEFLTLIPNGGMLDLLVDFILKNKVSSLKISDNFEMFKNGESSVGVQFYDSNNLKHTFELGGNNRIVISIHAFCRLLKEEELAIAIEEALKLKITEFIMQSKTVTIKYDEIILRGIGRLIINQNQYTKLSIYSPCWDIVFDD